MYNVVSKAEKAHNDGVWCVTWSGNNRVITGSVDETVKGWNISSENTNTLDKPLFSLGDHDLAIVSVTSSPDGSVFASSSMDGVIRVFDGSSASPKLLKSIQAGPTETWNIHLNPQSATTLASGTHAGNINIWDVKTGEKKTTYQTGAKFTMCVRYSPDGCLLASGGYDGAVCLFDAQNNNLIKKLPGHNKPVRTVAFSKNSEWLVTGSEDQHINVYEVKSGEQIASLTGHKSWVLDTSTNPVVEYQFVSSSSDKKIKC